MAHHHHAHHQGHDRGHTHGAGHHHHHGEVNTHGPAFLIAIALNSIFVVIEFAYGFVAHSTALMADAGHNLSDVLGLALAWGAARLATKAPTAQYTYGMRSSSILAALANALLLLVACGGIAWESIQRITSPPVVASSTVMLVAAAGIVVNGLSAWLFAKGSKEDLNIRGAYMHMAADALISLGVVVAGGIMMVTGWYWLDPVVSIAIVALIVWGTWGLLREAIQLALSAVPTSIDFKAVQDFLSHQTGVTGVHDLHIWGMSTTESALTVHLVMPQGHPGDQFVDDLTRQLKARFSISHSTLQIELGTTVHACSLHPAGDPHGSHKCEHVH